MEDDKTSRILGELTTEDVRRLHGEARALRMSISHLTQTAATRRRKSVLVLAVAIWFTIWGHDQHIEKCVVDGPVTNRGEFVCDVTFPLHNHATDRAFILGDGPIAGEALPGQPAPGPRSVTATRPESDYPVNGNALGMVLYLTALGLGIRWAYRPRSHNEL